MLNLAHRTNTIPFANNVADLTCDQYLLYVTFMNYKVGEVERERAKAAKVNQFINQASGFSGRRR